MNAQHILQGAVQPQDESDTPCAEVVGYGGVGKGSDDRTIGQPIQRIRSTRLLVVGDVMVDAYLWGRVDRISPEAPVPVVQVTEHSARLGGAANVAINAHVLGAQPTVVTVLMAQ